MALLFESWLLELVAVLITLSAGLYVYFTLCYQHWKKKGIPYLEPSFPFGNITDVVLRQKSISENFDSIYRRLEGHKVGGFYQVNRPCLLIRDPEMIKSILVKDFVHFQDHDVHANKMSDHLSGNLFMLGGVKWKHLRQKLTPSFTSVKTKRLFPILLECGQDLKTHLAPLAARNETIEITDIVARYTIDVIASSGFGIQSNSLKNPDSEFRTMIGKVLAPSFRSTVRNLLMFTAPKIGALIDMPMTTREVSDFFGGVVKETVEHRERNDIERNDFLQLLIDLKNNKHELAEENGTKPQDETTNKEKNLYDVKGLTIDEITAQVFFFLLAGYETSTGTAGFCLYELALNQGIQDRLREEIDSAMAEHGGKLTYEAVLGMNYMARVVLETMRKYPVFPFLPRICTKEYQLPDSEARIELGTSLVVPTHALHHDPQYYPSPDVFDPDRFTDEVKSSRHQYVYLPFGEGPRICIASKFAEMQVKVGIASFISNFKVSVCETYTAIPLVMDSNAFLISPKGGIKLRISERS